MAGERLADGRPRCCVPEPQRAVLAARDQPPAVRGKRDGQDIVRVAGERLADGRPRCCVPEPQRAVVAARDQPPAVRGKRDGQDIVRVAGERLADGRTRGRVPEPQRAVSATRDQAPAVRGKRDGQDPAVVGKYAPFFKGSAQSVCDCHVDLGQISLVVGQPALGQHGQGHEHRRSAVAASGEPLGIAGSGERAGASEAQRFVGSAFRIAPFEPRKSAERQKNDRECHEERQHQAAGRPEAGAAKTLNHIPAIAVAHSPDRAESLVLQPILRPEPVLRPEQALALGPAQQLTPLLAVLVFLTQPAGLEAPVLAGEASPAADQRLVADVDLGIGALAEGEEAHRLGAQRLQHSIERGCGVGFRGRTLLDQAEQRRATLRPAGGAIVMVELGQRLHDPLHCVLVDRMGFGDLCGDTLRRPVDRAVELADGHVVFFGQPPRLAGSRFPQASESVLQSWQLVGRFLDVDQKPLDQRVVDCRPDGRDRFADRCLELIATRQRHEELRPTDGLGEARVGRAIAEEIGAHGDHDVQPPLVRGNGVEEELDIGPAFLAHRGTSGAAGLLAETKELLELVDEEDELGCRGLDAPLDLGEAKGRGAQTRVESVGPGHHHPLAELIIGGGERMRQAFDRRGTRFGDDGAPAFRGEQGQDAGADQRRLAGSRPTHHGREVTRADQARKGCRLLFATAKPAPVALVE